MKNIILSYVFCLCLFSPYLYSESLIQDLQKSEHQVNQLTHRIIYRFYLINRLTPTIKIFFLFLQNNSEDSFYKNNSTVTCIESIKKNWEDFCAYRYISDANFEISFIKCIYILIQNFILDIDILGEISNKNYNDNQSTSEMINSMEQGMRILLGQKSMRLPFSISSRITVDTITQCFYMAKRLNHAIKLLHRADQCSLFLEKRAFIVHDLELDCTHPRIIQVVHDILQKKSIKPLLKLCEEFQQYRYADDSPFLREMLSVLLITYRDLLHSTKTSEQEHEIIEEKIGQMLTMYQDVDVLSTEEVLDCIDSVTDYLDKIIIDIEDRNTWYHKFYSWIFG